jgi:hypothetical protein
MNGEELVVLLVEHKIGITFQTHKLLELSENQSLIMPTAPDQ